MCNVYSSGKAKSITYTECVFVRFGIQHVVHIIVSSVASLAVQYISISIKQHDFWKKKGFGHKMGVLIFSATFLILRRTEQDVIKMYIAVHVKNPLILSYMKET